MSKRAGSHDHVVRAVLGVLLALSLVVGLVPGTLAQGGNVTVVSISSPTNAAPVYVGAGANFTVNYTADGSGAGFVAVYVGPNQVVGSPFAVTFPQPSGTQVVTVPGGLGENLYDLRVDAWRTGQAVRIRDVELDAVIVDNTNPTVPTVIQPNGGQNWAAGSVQNITWTPATDANMDPNGITLQFSPNNGASWTQIATGEANDGVYAWTVSGSSSNQCLIRVIAADRARRTNQDDSDVVFTIYGVDTTPPSVNLTNPLANAFVAGAAYQVTADAADDQSGIAQVAFAYDIQEDVPDAGPVSIGVDTVPPYAVPWNTIGITDGVTVTVKAQATNGAGATSAWDTEANITVDNSAPTGVAVTTPAPAAFIGGAAYAVTGTATDEHSGIAQMQFFYSTDGVRWTSIGIDTIAPYSVLWDTTVVPDGVVRVRGDATNGAGLVTQSTNTNITIDNTAPVVPATTLISPNGAEVWQLGTVYNITWNIAGPLGIVEANLQRIQLDLSWDGGVSWNNLFAGANVSPFPWRAVGVPSANCLVKITAVDKAGNTASDVSDAVFTIWGIDSTAPEGVAVTRPAGPSTGVFDVTGTATDAESGIQNVEFRYSTDGGTRWNSIGSDTTAPFAVSFDSGAVPVNSNNVLFQAIATNGVGLQTTSGNFGPVVVDNSAPIVTLTAPAGGALVADNVTLTSTANDAESGVAPVAYFYWDWTLPTPAWVATASTWDSTVLPDGTTSIRVVATNGVGLTAEAINIVYVNNDPNANTHFAFSLAAGWNLISAPLIPNDENLPAVLGDAASNTEQVVSFFWDGGVLTQRSWIPPVIAELTTVEDGQGYWLRSTVAQPLVIQGVPLLPPPAQPPSYVVEPGWNLIGFKSTVPQLPNAYLKPAVYNTVQQMYGYDTATGLYYPIAAETNLNPGEGYWLAVSTHGTIWP